VSEVLKFNCQEKITGRTEFFLVLSTILIINKCIFI